MTLYESFINYSYNIINNVCGYNLDNARKYYREKYPYFLSVYNSLKSLDELNKTSKIFGISEYIYLVGSNIKTLKKTYDEIEIQYRVENIEYKGITLNDIIQKNKIEYTRRNDITLMQLFKGYEDIVIKYNYSSSSIGLFKTLLNKVQGYDGFKDIINENLDIINNKISDEETETAKSTISLLLEIIDK